MNQTFPHDDDLLAQLDHDLKALVGDADRVNMLMSGYDLVMGDVTLAELTFDSTRAAVAVRADDVTSETLVMTFRSGNHEIDFEWSDGRIIGRVDPADCTVHLDRMGTSELVEPDEFGTFEFADLGVGSFRIRLSSPLFSSDIATPWISPTMPEDS